MGFMFRFTIGPRVDELLDVVLSSCLHIPLWILGSEASETALALPHFETPLPGTSIRSSATAWSGLVPIRAKQSRQGSKIVLKIHADAPRPARALVALGVKACSSCCSDLR